MSKRILILTQPDDIHALAVAEVIDRKGGEAILWHTSDFPAQLAESFYVDGGGTRIHIHGVGLNLETSDFDVVWHRRPNFVLDKDILAPADLAYAELTCKYFRTGFLGVLAPQAFWVNRLGSEMRCSKMLQQTIAAQIGLALPETLYSNDPLEIRTFIRRQREGKVVYKSVAPALPWKSGDKIPRSRDGAFRAP